MSQPQCDSCRFWEQFRDDKGTCRRYPPRLSETAVSFYVANEPPDDEGEPALINALSSLDAWWMPVTHSSEWCGEHQPAPNPSPATDPPSPQ